MPSTPPTVAPALPASDRAGEAIDYDAADRRRRAWSLGASLFIHASVGLAVTYLGVSHSPQLFVSEVGPNSIALVASMANDVPPSEVEVVLPQVTVRKSDTDGQVAPTEPKLAAAAPPPVPPPHVPPPEVPMPRERAIEEDEEPADEAAEKPEPAEPTAARTEEEAQRPQPREPQPTSTPPRAEKDHETEAEKVEVSAASVSSAPADPSRGANVDQPPRPIYNPSPEYPPGALSSRAAGRVVLRVRVGADGKVLAAALHTTSGSDLLDQAALKAVSAWQFEPARRAGIAIEREIAVPIRFVIGNGR